MDTEDPNTRDFFSGYIEIKQAELEFISIGGLFGWLKN